MASLLSLLLTLHVGTLTVPPTAAARPFRVQAREFAAAAALRRPDLIGIALPASSPSRASDLPTAALPTELAPAPAVERAAWATRFADRLDLRRTGLVGAAFWLASIPVQLDVRPGHFSMAVTVHAG